MRWPGKRTADVMPRGSSSTTCSCRHSWRHLFRPCASSCPLNAGATKREKGPLASSTYHDTVTASKSSLSSFSYLHGSTTLTDVYQPASTTAAPLAHRSKGSPCCAASVAALFDPRGRRLQPRARIFVRIMLFPSSNLARLYLTTHRGQTYMRCLPGGIAAPSSFPKRI